MRIRQPFIGPIIDVDGNQRVLAGDEISDEDLLRMCWYVDRVGEIDEEGLLGPGTVPNGCGGDY